MNRNKEGSMLVVDDVSPNISAVNMRTQEFISKFSVPFTQPYDFDELINNALFELRDFTKTDRAIILEFQPDGSLVCTHEDIISEDTPKVLGRQLPYLGVKPVLDEAEKTGCFYEKEAAVYFEKYPATDLGEKSFCYIPLVIGGNRAGYLVFFTMFEKANWAEGEFRLATMAGSIIAGAYSRKMSEEALLATNEAELRTQEFISRFSVPFTQPYDFDELINNALFELRDFTRTDRAIILEFQSDGSLVCTHEDVISEDTPKVLGRSLPYLGVKPVLDEAEKTGCFYEKEASVYFEKYPDTNLGEKSFCYIPLVIGGNRAGYLVFFTMFEEADWDEGEFRLATMAGSIIAGAYSRKISEDALLATSKAELRTQQFISRFSVPFTQTYDFDELINNALFELRDFTSTDRAIILEFQPDGSLLCTHEDVISEDTPKVLGRSLPYLGVKPVLDEAEKTGCFYEKEAAVYFEKYPDTNLGEKSFCYIPLTIGGNRAGYLVFFTMFEKANWAEGEFRLATMAGSIIAGAYSRKISEDALLATNKAELRTQEFISRFSVPFTQSYDFDVLINNALFALRDFTNTDRAIILEFQPDGSLLCTHEDVISEDTPKVLGRSLSYLGVKPVLDEAEKSGCFYEKEAAVYFEKYPATDLGEKSFCYIPLTIGGNRAGYLVFFTMFEKANWAEGEFRLATMAGSIIAGAYSRKISEEALLATNEAELRNQEFISSFSVPFTQSYDFDVLINNALFALRDFTKTDRAIILEFQPDGSLLCTHENVISEDTPKVLGRSLSYLGVKPVLDEAEKTGCFYEKEASAYFEQYPATDLGEKSFCYIPLTIGGNRAGYLVFFTMFEQANWAEGEFRLATMAGSIIAGAYSRKMSEEAILAANEVELRTQEFISRFSVPFTQSYDFDELINNALFALRDFTKTDRAIILEFQPDGSLLCTHESVISEDTPKVLGRSLPYLGVKPVLDEAEKTGCFYEKEASVYFEQYPATDLGEKSFCYIPLTIGGNRAGYLVFFTMFEQANWAEGEFRLATMAGSIIAGAYSRKMSEEAILAANETELRSQEFISSFSVPFTQPYAFDVLINNALFELRDFTGTDRALILEFQADGTLLCTHENVISANTPKVLGRSLIYEEVKLLLDEAERTGCFYEKEAKRYFETHQMATNLGEKSFCCIPLTIGGNRAGYLVFNSMFEEANWAEGEFRLATMAGSIIAGAYSRKLSEQAILAAKEAELRTQEFISTFSVPFTQPYDFDELINNALFELRDFTRTDRALILEFQPDQTLLCTHENVISANTPKALGMSLSYEDMKPVLDEAEKTGCFYEKEAAVFFEQYPATSLGEKSFCYIPLMIEGERAGYLVFFTMFEEADWDQDEFRLVTMTGSIITGAFSVRKNDELREAALRAQQESEAKSNFLSVMSHEIRTPMNSIMGFAELAKNAHDLTPQLDSYLSKIMDNTQWLLRIINDVLDISKIESGKMELERVPFGLQEVLSRCHSVVLPEVSDKGLDMRVYAEPIHGRQLLGDPVRLYQALLNLFSNAIKFTQSGFIRLSAIVRNVDDKSAAIYFEVKDTGIGLSEEQIAKIFEPFMQADSSTTRTYGGTGLGLSITKNIVELMGGQLMVESELGVGSVFSFEINFETIDVDFDDARRIRPDVIERPYFEGLVLVCDDNLMNQQVMCGHLESVGLKTVVADNGREAVSIVEERQARNEKPFDLILMDIFMPVLDGIEAARLITKLDTGTPIVAVTANIMTGEIEKYKKHGMPEHLGKPFTSQELWRTLLKFLTPRSSQTIDREKDEQSKNEMLHALRVNFVMNNQTKSDEIKEALESGDTILAHRLAHTLKSNAGFIIQPGLQGIAAEIESLILKREFPIPDEKLAILEKELAMVLEELNPLRLDELASREAKQTLSPQEIAALFTTLEGMLEDRNPESMNHLAAIRAVPGTTDFARHIEQFDFESAIRELDELKKKFKGA